MVMSRPKARGLVRGSGNMNRTEAAYAKTLEGEKHLGFIIGYWFEAINFRLGAKCYYRPDFLVQMADGTLQIHEVKGFWQDDALVKIKVAAEQYPFIFVAVSKVKPKDGGGWSKRMFSPDGVVP